MIWKVGAVVVGIFAVGAVIYFAAISNPINQPVSMPDVARACTEEAKVCPDGATVGRTGPNCTFADCPIMLGSSTPASTGNLPTTSVGTLKLHLGEKGTFNSVTLTPQAIISDSRCPADPQVQCVWAGTVILKVLIESALASGVQEIELHKIITTEADTISLKEISPAKSAGSEIATSTYEFTFEIERRVPGH